MPVHGRFETKSAGKRIFSYSMAEIIRGRSATTSVKRMETRKALANIASLNRREMFLFRLEQRWNFFKKKKEKRISSQLILWIFLNYPITRSNFNWQWKFWKFLIRKISQPLFRYKELIFNLKLNFQLIIFTKSYIH